MFKLIDFLKVYNFRYCTPNCEVTDKDYNNSCSIRIFYDDENYSRWFEIGINDWYGGISKVKEFKEIIKEDILNLYIYDIKINDTINIVEVYLTKDGDFCFD